MSDTFTERQRRELAGRARTLHERLAGPANVAGGEPAVAPEAVLAAWQEQFPDAERFRARLAHEGLTRERVRAAVEATHWPPDEPLPDWVSTVEALVAHVEATGDGEVAVTLSDERPFRELFEAVAAFARGRLPDVAVPAGALDPLVEGLADRLQSFCAGPLYVEFKSYVEYHDEELAFADPGAFAEPPREHYRGFVASMFEGGFRNLCLDRFGVDGTVTELIPLSTVGYARGRVPVRVSFEEGAVVYKPRSVEADAAFHETATRLQDHLSTPPLRTPTYLPREGYGWMETVDPEDPADGDDARRYYRRAGALTCLAYVLGVVDRRPDDVLTCRDRPAVVDAETLFHPSVDAGGDHGTNPIPSLVDRTTLRTGFLPYAVDPPGDPGYSRPAAIAAGENPRDRPGPSFEAVNTDVMSATGTTPEERGGTDGRPHPPDEYVDELVAGFERTHETLRQLHADGAFFGSIVDPELIEGVETRFAFRPAAEYASVLDATGTRAALRDGVRFTVELEDLATRFFDGTADPDRFWSLYAAERDALVRRDLPRFVIRPDRTTVFHEGRPLGVEIDSPGVDCARERLDRLDADDRRRQSALVSLSFDREPPPRELPRPVTVTDERLVDTATDLFEAILDATVGPAGDRQWASPHQTAPLAFVPTTCPLNYGKCGIALAGAALYDATGRDRYRRLVGDLVEEVVDYLGAVEAPVERGGTHGVGSVVYALSAVAGLVDDRTARDAARDAAGLVPEDRPDDDPFDVTRGTAGELLGLLAYYERFEDPAVLDRAIELGEYLLASSRRHGGHEVWETVDGEPATGFAHGQSGIAWSLARLADVAGDRRFAAPARDALAFETDRSRVDGTGSHRSGSATASVTSRWWRRPADASARSSAPSHTRSTTSAVGTSGGRPCSSRGPDDSTDRCRRPSSGAVSPGANATARSCFPVIRRRSRTSPFSTGSPGPRTCRCDTGTRRRCRVRCCSSDRRGPEIGGFDSINTPVSMDLLSCP
ncbi:type 2 lantipeptide synthetase LanM [Halobacteriales archaeon QS_1_68_20]|nr:MAG: type 2 lantipeptide synthetase LanM [Halobacteriales archaeon QS_1_68_20]